MKSFIIVDSREEELTHVAEVDGKKITLRRSKSDIWNDSCKGEPIGTLKDTGNGIKIKLEDKKIDLDYSEFMDLVHLMTIKCKIDPDL